MHTHTSTDFAILIGWDWGDQSHAIAHQSPGCDIPTSNLPHSAESPHPWLDQLETSYSGRPVAVAIEASKGAVVYALLERPWIIVYPIHLATSTRQRSAFRPSGAKDDLVQRAGGQLPLAGQMKQVALELLLAELIRRLVVMLSQAVNRPHIRVLGSGCSPS